jgi:flagellar motor switch protein FliG
MALMGKQKAAMLLMGLDSATATALLKDVAPEQVQELAIELARMEVAGERDKKEEARIVRDFCKLLKAGSTQGLSMKGFLNEVLISVLGKDKAEQIQSHIRDITTKKDVFATIRSAGAEELARALDGEHPQTVAVVLSELPVSKSQEILPLLDEEASLKAVCKMTNPDVRSAGVRHRIASLVSDRLRSFEGEGFITKAKKPQQALRELAILLSGLETELRDRLLDEVNKYDEETCSTVRMLMITWEDIPTIADRSLQEALRGIEGKTLAVALFGADEDIAQKIRSNMSDRAVAAVDEEASLMQEPLEKEVVDAREQVVAPLRQANEEGTLRRAQR